MEQQLPREKLEQHLLLKKQQIEEQLRSLEVSDPVLADGLTEVSELGTDAWQADAHAKVVVLKNSLTKLLSQIQNSLRRIRDGSYGLCEKCGRRIHTDRLEAMPTASCCIVCC